MSPSRAVTFAVILSIFLLLLQTHARHMPKKTSNTEYVEFHPSKQTERIPGTDLAREIAHSFRLPMTRHMSRKKPVEISYGNDMVGLPRDKKFTNKFKGVDEDDDMKKKLKWISRYFN